MVARFIYVPSETYVFVPKLSFAKKTGTVGSYTTAARAADKNTRACHKIVGVRQMGFVSHLPENEYVYALGPPAPLPNSLQRRQAKCTCQTRATLADLIKALSNR